MNILTKIIKDLKEKRRNDEDIKKKHHITKNDEKNNDNENKLKKEKYNKEMIKIEKNSFYIKKSKNKLKRQLENLELEDLYLDNNNLREILNIYFKILSNNYDIFEEEIIKNNNKISLTSIPIIKKNIELIMENKKNIDNILKNKLSETNKKYFIKKNEGAYGEIYENMFNKLIIIKNFDLEKIYLIDIYFEYFIQYILYNFSDDIYKLNLAQPYDLKLTTDMKSARLYMEKLNGITLHSFIYKKIINEEYNIKKKEQRVILDFLGILKNIINIFIYLQKRYNFIHFDLHLGNILIDIENNNQIYLIDFGFSSIQFEYNNNEEPIYIVCKPKYLIYTQTNDKLKYKNKSIDMVNLFLRLCRLLSNKINNSNRLIEKIFNIINNIFSFENNAYIKNNNKTLYDFLKTNLDNDINLSYKYSTNIYFLKKELKDVLNIEEYNNIGKIIDRFNPNNLIDIINYYIENIYDYIDYEF